MGQVKVRYKEIMIKPRHSKSKKTYLRKQKARIRRDFLSVKDQEEEIKKLYENKRTV